MPNILIDKQLLEDMLDELYERKGSIDWYKDSGYGKYERDYRDLRDLIKKVEDLLKDETKIT
jgi:hypothetical protein